MLVSNIVRHHVGNVSGLFFCVPHFLNIYPPLKAIWHFFPSLCFSSSQASFLTFFFSSRLFRKFHAYCAQRMERHVFVLDGSTTSKKTGLKS